MVNVRFTPESEHSQLTVANVRFVPKADIWAARIRGLTLIKRLHARFGYLKQRPSLSSEGSTFAQVEHVPTYSHSNRWVELAEHAVTNGLSLAKSVGAKVTVIVVEKPFNWLSVSETQTQWALEERAKHAEQIKKHAASVLNSAADAAKQAGVPCDTI